MTNRERFRAIAKFERPGDLWIDDGFWQETLISWVEHGAPPQLTGGAFRGAYFGFDHRRGTGEIISGLVQVPYVAGDIESYLAIPPIVPQFEPKVLEEDKNILIILNQWGQTVKVLKDHPCNVSHVYDAPLPPSHRTAS